LFLVWRTSRYGSNSRSCLAAIRALADDILPVFARDHISRMKVPDAAELPPRLTGQRTRSWPQFYFGERQATECGDASEDQREW
jgi:hypothetical protein